ncbi:LysR family transcriptional regulator [Citrobacter freundii]|uniref:LysR family transcriptional regulator n=1 Tax=Citrobacter freundii TaxID=546 RepID=A0AA44SHS4_CITFR|nr:LysR family transcriptional regulator [Citrobacter freundii]OYQ91264.1 LysR family transcriptional regulator [Citrobacter freundii]OYQ93081.1 LysR family transcriptional regulator [Citrobacter freundii]
MARENFNDLTAFIAIAREKNFTKAAAQLGVSQSALSHSLRTLETRLGVRLLTRTTRSVSLTDMGEILLSDLGPYIDGIHEKLNSFRELNEKPSGTIRISAADYSINTILWPKLRTLIKEYPEVTLELIDDYSLTDIVANRFDAGVRFGEQITNGMVSVRIGPDVKFTVIGSPNYFENRTLPTHPQELIEHTCINLRFPTHGNLYIWEFEKDGKKENIKASGQLVFGRIYQALDAAIEGCGLAHVPRDIAEKHIERGDLISVLDDWCPYWDGYYLYYPSRRQPSKAFPLLIDTLRYHK